MGKRRYWFSPWIIFIGLFIVMISRLIQYHCFPDPRVLTQSQHQYWSRTPVKANRGLIQDSKNNILAFSNPISSFFIDPKYWRPSDAPALKGLIPENVYNKISTSPKGRFIWLVRRVSPSLAQKILSLHLRGVYEIKEKKREYPNGSLLAHVLGFCDIDDNGQAGIELAWDSSLYEPPGYRVLVRQAGGPALELGEDNFAGNKDTTPAVTVTIDARMQYVVEKHLNAAMVEHGAKWGAAICMNPNTGAILSMASSPTFDPNKREEIHDSRAIVNNAVSRAYEPGSTFKPIFMGIALEQGLVRTNESFFCPARLKVADGFISEAYQKGMGTISTAEILIKSSNVGMAQIGIRSKPLDMYRTLLNWGFGKVSDIELRGIEKGLMASPGQWRGVVPANISIGQGIAVTPLQLITAMAAIVNGGKLLSPYIIQEVLESNGSISYRGYTHEVREVLTPETCQWIRKVMREAAVSGTGRRANTPVTEIATKTGTAQVAERGKYAKGRHVASIIGFWPYSNPQYLMLVVIGEPTNGKYYGGEVAGPVFKKIVESMAELEIFKTASGGLS